MQKENAVPREADLLVLLLLNPSLHELDIYIVYIRGYPCVSPPPPPFSHPPHPPLHTLPPSVFRAAAWQAAHVRSLDVAMPPVSLLIQKNKQYLKINFHLLDSAL